MTIKDGPYEPKHEVDGLTTRKPLSLWDENDYKRLRENANAINILHCAPSAVEFNRISGCETAHEIWQKLEVTYKGTYKVKEAKIDLL